MSPELTHIDAHGRASMVDVTAKPATHRRAFAKCRVIGLDNTARRIAVEGAEESILCAAQVAGLTAGKLTSRLIPLCHPIPLIELSVELRIVKNTVEISATAETIGQTGVEMEALTACAVSALSVIADAKAADPLAAIDDLTLWEKTGGRSGTWRRRADLEMEHDDPDPT